MEFEAKYEIEKAVSKDQFRQMIGVTHLEVETKRLLATDGHMLAVVPIKVTEGDVTGPVPVDAIKAARKAAGKHGDAVILAGKESVTVLHGGSTAAFRRDDVGPFPFVDAVIPKHKEGDEDTITIGIDAKSLLDLAKAIGTDGKVTLTFPAKADGDPFFVKPIDKANDAFGVLMPIGKGR